MTTPTPNINTGGTTLTPADLQAQMQQELTQQIQMEEISQHFNNQLTLVQEEGKIADKLQPT